MEEGPPRVTGGAGLAARRAGRGQDDFLALLTCSIMSLQAFMQARHSFAHRFMWASSGNSSQALAHTSQTLTQASQVVTAVGPYRPTTLAAREQKSAQSRQVRRVMRCFFSPLLIMWVQWAKQLSHSRMQSAQALAHFSISLCLCSSAAIAGPSTTRLNTATRDTTRRIMVHPPPGASLQDSL